MTPKGYTALIVAVIIIFLVIAGFWVYQTKFAPAGKNSSEESLPINLPPIANQAPQQQTTNITNQNNTNQKHMITISTNFGDITFQTFDNDAPKTVQNFITLAQKGFYNNLTFHRVIKGFMIQGGDPNCTPSRSASACGTGGPGYAFEDELNPATESFKVGYQKGVVAMANSGPNTNGSQFFIMLAPTPLPHSYTIFGKVVKGQEVVDAIGNVKTDPSNDRPVETVEIKSVKVK